MPRIAGGIRRYLKIVVTGPVGAGKTRFGLDGGTGELWPDLLVANSEGGVVAYEFQFPGKFRVEDTNSVTTLLDLIQKIKAGVPGYKCETLLIDTWTVFRDNYRTALDMLQAKNGKGLGTKEFAKVNMKLAAIQSELMNMPCHVIIVAHETDMYEPGSSGADLRLIGVKIDANKTLSRWPDFILKFQERRDSVTQAFVAKSRGTALGDKNLMIKNPSWSGTFKAIADRWAAGDAPPELDDQSAINTDAESIAREEAAFLAAAKREQSANANANASQNAAHNETTYAWPKARAKAWSDAWIAKEPGFDLALLKEILGVKLFNELPPTFHEADADAKVIAWIEAESKRQAEGEVDVPDGN